MMQLHYYPGNASMVPHILLEEIGLTYERVLVDRTAGAHKGPEYLKLNPNGQIPVLSDGGLVLYETAAIALHLCDTHPDAQLAPAVGTSERANFYKWLMWFTNTLQATLMIYFYPERWVAEGNVGAAAEVKLHAERKVAGLLDQVDGELARHGGPWFGGAGYSALDAYAFTMCRWTRNFSNEAPARSRSNVGPYLERMLAREAVQRVLANEKLAPPFV
jgi:glutathione S-transferase